MQNYTGLEIAVIGMAGRFPGAGNIQEFWQNLANGVESVKRLSEEEILAEGEEESLLRNSSYVKANAFLDNKEYFDAAFFNYRPDEAKLMDPQMRLFHECVWQALEDAGCNPYEEKNKIALFAGTTGNVNWELYSTLINEGWVDNYSAYQLRNARFMSTKISYALNLRGPSVIVDTACSTSLAAIQQACRSLIVADCNVAIAGGVSISNRSKKGYLYEEGMVTSSDGCCRPFDAAANGTVAGEGVGVVVLKRLKNALADKDNILAIIKGAGINNDGNNKVGYTAPSIDGQVEAILMAHKWAKTEPGSIGYVEAHGTGTRLGDPVEVEALNRVFGKSSEKYCAIGSVKSNIGHLDAAAGVAGFIKTVLALQHRKIPASLNFTTPNPAINFTESPFYVNNVTSGWRKNKFPLRAGVSSFGIGGTNVHVVLEEAPVAEASSGSRPYQLLLLSAKTATALERNTQQLRGYLEKQTNEKLPDIAYTLQAGRTAFAYRRMLVCENVQEAIDQLTPGMLPEPVQTKAKPLTVFMFSGQGSQYIKMCYELYRQEKLFRDEVDKCFESVKKIAGRDLKSVVFPANAENGHYTIDDTENTQPLLFIMEYGLARLFMKWGIHPDMMIGHSIGEYVAACISGVFSLEDALYLVIKRGELMQKAPRGIMLGISVSENELNPLLSAHKEISLATVNSSELCVVSGEEERIDHFRTVIESSGYKSSVIRTSHAFHSHMMDGILDEFEKIVGSVPVHPQQIPFISNLTGKKARNEEITSARYWVNHLRKTVRFSDGIVTAFENKEAVFIEVGPGKALSTFVRSHRGRQKGHRVVNTVRHWRESENDNRYLMRALGELWQTGLTPDWEKIYEQESRRKVSLPAYSFDKIKYPVNVDASKMIMEMIADKTQVKNPDISNWFYAASWQLAIPVAHQPAPTTGCTLLLADKEGVSDALVKKYENNNETIITVKAGNDFKELSPVKYEIHPGREEDYHRLIAAVKKQGQAVNHIVHSWGISKEKKEKYTEGCVNNCFNSIWQLFNACRKEKIQFRQIVVLTNDLHSIVQNSNGAAVKALSLPLLKVIAQEFPAVINRHIDISLSENSSNELLSTLYNEIHSRDNGKVTALRHGQKWEQVYTAILPGKDNQAPVLKEAGVYLITGGLGDVGFAIAMQLVRKLKARVILAGRSKIPERNRWEEILQTGSAEEALLQKINKLIALEKEGGELLYQDVDVADKAALQSALSTAEKKFGSVNGVIHAAGIVAGESICPVSEMTKQKLEEQLVPKIKGLHALEEVLKNRELDFCLLTSSLSAVLGGIGFGAYAPANIYMDHYVRLQKEKGALQNWISVNFDGIEQPGKQTSAINLDELLPVIEKLLSLKHLSCVQVSPADLPKRIEKWVYRNASVGKNADSDVNIDTDTTTTVVKAVTTTEATMLALWQNFFGLTEIQTTDDFFDIGGDSLKAITMIGRIHKTLDVEVPVHEFFKNSTIEKLSAYIKSVNSGTGNTGNRFEHIPRAKPKEQYLLSSAQKRLYFLYELDKQSLAYNLFQAARLKGKPDKEKLDQAFKKLIQRHEVLRTSFQLMDEEPVQKIHDQVDFSIEYFQATEDAVETAVKNFIRPFALDKAPLLRVGIIRLKDEEHILVADMHHIISDGVSQGVMIKDFMSLYNEEVLPQLPLQYKDYAEWQQDKEQQKKIAMQKEFLLNAFAELPAMPELPMDYTRPAMWVDEGKTIHFTIEKNLSQKIKQVSAQEEVSVFVLLLSLLSVMLRKLTGEEDIIIGTNTAGRMHAEIENCIGIFVNTLPLRNYPKAGISFREFLSGVKERTLSFFDNQAYQYEELVDELSIERSSNRNPLFDVLLLYQNFQVTKFSIPGLELETYDIEQTKSKFDLSLIVLEEQDELRFAFEYSTALFSAATISYFISCFQSVTATALADPDKKIAEI